MKDLFNPRQIEPKRLKHCKEGWWYADKLGIDVCLYDPGTGDARMAKIPAGELMKMAKKFGWRTA